MHGRKPTDSRQRPCSQTRTVVLGPSAVAPLFGGERGLKHNVADAIANGVESLLSSEGSVD